MKKSGFLSKISTLALGVVAIALMTESAGAAGFGNLAPGRINKRSYISESGYTLAPFAHIKFCMLTPDQCARASGPDKIAFSPENRQRVMMVNRQVNSSVRPQLDAPGKEEWRLDATAGSCNDFAVIKRKKLIDAGFSPAAIRLAVARTQTGEGHAVVVIRTSQGDLVLDNRTNAIRRWNETDLRWVKIQSGRDPKRWMAI